MRRLLIDGTNIARIHFSSNPARDVDGNPAGIIKGMLGLVLRVNDLWKPQEIVCFWDGPGGSVQRRALYKDYKGNRKPRSIVGTQYQFASPKQAEENYDWQTEKTRELLEYCGINSIVTESYEADDGIAYTIQLNSDDEHLIVSCDKDFFQLVNDKTQIYNPQSKKIVSKETITKEWNIHPSNWLFFRAITGDAGDNLKGVKGFGAKTLAKLFDLNTDTKNSLKIIDEGLMILNEIKEDPNHDYKDREKRIYKRLKQLEENIQIIERNWKLMDLSDPLMPLNRKEEVKYQLDNFESTINQKNFYIEMGRLGLGINAMMPLKFAKVRKK